MSKSFKSKIFNTFLRRVYRERQGVNGIIVSRWLKYERSDKRFLTLGDPGRGAMPLYGHAPRDIASFVFCRKCGNQAIKLVTTC